MSVIDKNAKPLGFDVRICVIEHHCDAPGLSTEERVIQATEPWCETCRSTAGRANHRWYYGGYGFTFMTYSQGEPSSKPCFTCGQNTGEWN